jgi:excisionase family DNA binding protein
VTKNRSRLLLTVAEAADELGIGRSTLYAALKSGECEIRTVVIGKQLRIPRVTLEELAGRTRPAQRAEEAADGRLRRCPTCGASTRASITLPTCSAAFWSSSVTGSV